MRINIQKLKGKMAENNMNVEQIANEIGINRTTFYRKLNSGGGQFTVSEIQGIVSTLKMSPDEALNIFLAQ